MLKPIEMHFWKKCLSRRAVNESHVTWEVTRADLVKGLEFYSLTSPLFHSRTSLAYHIITRASHDRPVDRLSHPADVAPAEFGLCLLKRPIVEGPGMPPQNPPAGRTVTLYHCPLVPIVHPRSVLLIPHLSLIYPRPVGHLPGSRPGSAPVCWNALEISTLHSDSFARTYCVFFFDVPTCSRIPRSTRAPRSPQGRRFRDTGE